MVIHSLPSIILNPDVLNDTLTPSTILSRDVHTKELERCISPAFKGEKPLCVWIHGKSGTGKTTVACHTLSRTQKNRGIPGLYVNCWKRNSFYSILEYMINEMRRGFGDARDKSLKLDQFARLVKDRPFLIVLDELDLLPAKERDSVIYNLHSIGKVGLICISESRHTFLSLAPRLRSRLQPQMLTFEPYSDQEVLHILRDRARKALTSDCWDDETLKAIVKKAGSDARIAIQTLRNAAVYADSEGACRIELKHIKKGFLDTRGLRKTYELKQLTEHHRLLFRLISQRLGITSPDLYHAYVKECQVRHWKPIADRTFSLYTKRMAELKLIRAERARVKGRVHAFWIRG